MNTEIKKIRKFCCSTCKVEGHNKNNTKFHPAVPVVKANHFVCETCESKCVRLIEYCGLSGEEWNICEYCEIKFDEERIQHVDDPDMPNVFPYKKCSVCEGRSSCGSYNENHDWVCEGCTPEEEEDDATWICDECENKKEDIEDKLCHYCYHKSCENGDECWCSDEHCVCDFPKFQIVDGIQSCRHCGLNDHYKNGIVDDWSDNEDDEEEDDEEDEDETC